MRLALRPRHLLVLLFGSALCVIIYLTHPFYQTWHGFQAISATRRVLSNRPGVDKHPLLILQHLPAGSLASASRASHAIYAKAWGYRYAGDSAKYVADGPRGCLNKEHVLRQALVRELNSTRPAEWIVYSDADAIVSDPAVPLHSLLPPSTHPAHLLFGQDHNGVNAGVFVARVSRLALEFADRVLELAESNPDPMITDQHWIGVALRSNPSFGNAFAEMPRTWMNAYFLDQAGPGTGALGGDDKHTWKPQWQVHLVNQLKRKYAFRPLVERALGVYERGVEAAGGRYAQLAAREEEEEEKRGQVEETPALGSGSGRRREPQKPNGLDRLPQAAWAREHADEWWRESHAGLAGVRFLDEERMKIVDRDGVVLN